MNAWRAAQPDELVRLWPAARTAHVANSLDELKEFHATGPWRVRISDAGDAMVLARWREHLGMLAIRGLWVAEHRVPALIAEARGVARAQGFETVLTPLLSRSLHGAYVEQGMVEIEPIVALQGIPGRVAMRLAGGDAFCVRPANPSDVERLLCIDSASFNEFWRYGRDELERALTGERAILALDDGEIAGYASAVVRRETCTLGRLAVAPEARRKGLGSALVTDIARWAAGSGATVLSLCTQETNEASRALYARCGLIEVDERYGILAADV